MSRDVYEVQIAICLTEGGIGGYKVEHRFPDLPGIETIAALRDEAVKDFGHLFPDDEIATQLIYVMRLPERKEYVYTSGVVAET